MKKLPLHPAVHPFLRLKLGLGPLGRGLHQHLGHRGGHGPRRPHRRGRDGGVLRVPGSDGSLYRESHRNDGEILRQAPALALRQRPGSTAKLSTPWKSMWPATAAGAIGWTTNSPSPASPTLTITSWVHRSEWEEAAGAGRTLRRPCESLRAALLCRVARIASDNPKSVGVPGGCQVLPGAASPGGGRCPIAPGTHAPSPLDPCRSFTVRPYPVTTLHLQISSPDSWGGRPDSGTARPSRSRRRRQTTR